MVRSKKYLFMVKMNESQVNKQNINLINLIVFFWFHYSVKVHFNIMEQ